MLLSARAAGGFLKVEQRRSNDRHAGRGAGGSGLWDDWLIVFGRYLLAILIGNLLWETAQIPLYTIWRDGSPGQVAFAVVHCSAGDLLIASTALLGALALLGGGQWPYRRFGVVGSVAVAGGLAYTVFSEWLNTDIRGSWAYSVWMPRLPIIGTGLAPLGQWMAIPPLALLWARRGIRPGGDRPQGTAQA
jgi:hypothetical protein